MDAQKRDKIAEWLHGWRRPMLEAIRFYQDSDVVADAGKVREYSGVPIGSFNNHMRQLMDPPSELNLGPLVEIVERRDLGKGSPARVFALTERGERLFNDDVIPEIGFRQGDFERLKNRIENVEDENRELRTQLGLLRDNSRTDELEDRVDELEGKIEALISLVKKLREEMDGNPGDLHD